MLIRTTGPNWLSFEKVEMTELSVSRVESDYMNGSLMKTRGSSMQDILRLASMSWASGAANST